MPRVKDKKHCVAGLDLGGTKIYAGVADREGNLLAEMKAPTHPEEGQLAVIKRMARMVNDVQKKSNIEKIYTVGVGAPGQLDLGEGIVTSSGNLGWDNVPLRNLLEKELDLPVILDNDANVAALGESVYGAGRGYREMVYITVSTGIGSGIIAGGRLYHGIKGRAGELGHLTVKPGGDQCSCGKRGCLETLASGTAIAKAANRLIQAGRGQGIKQYVPSGNRGATAVEVGRAAAKGDREALEILQNAAEAIGLGISGVINLLNPACIVLGGGVMAMKELMWPDIIRAVREYTLKANLADVQIVPAGLGDRAGLLGAVALATGG